MNATFSVDPYKNNVLTWSHDIVDEGSHAPWARFLGECGSLPENKKFENIENVFNITQKFIKDHSEEILNVKTLDSHPPSWTRSTLFDDNVIKWAKASLYLLRT